jgi:IS30 family transposase
MVTLTQQAKKTLRRRDAGKSMRDIGKSYNVRHRTISRLAT